MFLDIIHQTMTTYVYFDANIAFVTHFDALFEPILLINFVAYRFRIANSLRLNSDLYLKINKEQSQFFS